MWTDRKRRFSNTMILCVIICELLAWRMLGKGRYRISGRSLALMHPYPTPLLMTRSPLFSPKLFYWPALSNWVTWNNWEKVRKNANTTFLRRFHQCCRCRILRSLLNTERIFGATLKFTDYFIDCYKYFTRYIFIILIWCNLNTKYLMALNFCGNLISWITDPFFR